MKDRRGLCLFRRFQRSADREDPATAMELHRLLADGVRTRGASAPHAMIVIDPSSLLPHRNFVLWWYSSSNEARAAA